MTTTTNDITNAMASGTILGAQVFWTLGGFELPREDLEKALHTLGMGSAYGRLPAVAKLITLAGQDLTSSFKGRWTTRKTKAGTALVRWWTGDDGKVTSEHVFTVIGKADRTVEVVDRIGANLDEDAHGARDVFQKLFKFHREMAQTLDLSRILTSCMKGTAKEPLLGAISLRDSGGIYFVPASKLEDLRKLSKWLDEQMGSSRLTILEIGDSGANAPEVSKAANDSFMADLKALKEEVQAFADSGKDATDYNVETRVERFTQLRERVGLWRHLLGAAGDSLEKAIQEAEAGVRETLSQGKPAPTPPKKKGTRKKAPKKAPEPEATKPSPLALEAANARQKALSGFFETSVEVLPTGEVKLSVEGQGALIFDAEGQSRKVA